MRDQERIISHCKASVENFHHYLYGRKFLIRTDHAALRWLLSFKNPEGQIARWIERLQQYDFEIKHREGKLHGNADGLSRRPCEDRCKRCSRLEETQKKPNYVLRTICEATDVEDWRRAQEEDEEIGLFLKEKIGGEKPTWQELSSYPPSTKYLWKIWDSIDVQQGMLF